MSDPTPPGADGAHPAQAAAAAEIVDLLGALAYAELSAFDRLADDARLAPSLTGRVQMSRMAGVEIAHHNRLSARLVELGVDPAVAMEPFVAALESFHSLTTPSTWLEAVVKAYVGDGLADDFYREIARLVDADTAALIEQVSTETDRAAFAVSEVRAAIAAQPAVAGRLALWARRLVGEAISQTQHVLADRESLMVLLITGGHEGGTDLGSIAAMLTRLTDRHEQRMQALGLSA